MRERKPQRIVEVGSGHSTRVLSRALGGVGEIVAIDPAPRADIIDLPGVRVVPSTLQAAPLELFDGLRAGDALFIDSSHILMPGSDVDILLNRVLPTPAGRRAGAHPRHLPAVRLSADLGLARLQRAAGRRCRCWRPAPTGRCSPAPGRNDGWAIASPRSVVPRLPRPADAIAGQPVAGEALMLGRLRDWLFDGGGPENLPERVREAIRQQQERSEILIGWAELVLVGLLAIAYETTDHGGRRGAGGLFVRDRGLRHLRRCSAWSA